MATNQYQGQLPQPKEQVCPKPTDSTFALDTSGSMTPERMSAMKTAMLGLAGADSSLSGRFAQFRERESIRLISFNGSVEPTEEFLMGADRAANAKINAAIADRVNALSAFGGTAVFSAARQAYIEAAVRRRADPNRFYSIVIMTDGVSNKGLSAEEFQSWYNQLPAEDKGVKVFPVLFGEGDEGQLGGIAKLTGGRVFDGRKANLARVFKEIRGYQ